MKAVLLCFTVAILLQSAQAASSTSPDRADVDTDCRACEYVMKFIRFQTVNQGRSVDAVKQRLKALFKTIPASAQNEEYLSNVEEYVKMIRNGMNVKSICKSLSKCLTKQPQRPEITKCQVCTAVVELIKFDITISNATVQVIIKAVEALCAVLGDVPVYEECKFILKELNQIIQWIEQKLTPEDICVKLGFCNSTMMSLISEFKARLYDGKISSSVLCDVCMKVVQKIDSILSELDSKLDDVEEEMNNVCDLLGDLAQQCKSMVDQFVDGMKKNVEYIEGKLDPSTTCKALHLCPSSPANV